jgi:hypothetical protein
MAGSSGSFGRLAVSYAGLISSADESRDGAGTGCVESSSVCRSRRQPAVLATIDVAANQDGKASQHSWFHH